jgi:hypothetical protein
VLAAIVCLLAAPAAQAKPDPRIAALQTKVSGLRLQVASLQRQVDALTATQTKDRAATVCYYALGQDGFAIVFKGMSQLARAITGNGVPAWENIPRYDDRGACAAAGLSRP